MNIRLVASRLMVIAAVSVAIFTEHLWAENGVGERALASAGFLCLLAGCIGRIWCAVHIAGRKNNTLVTEGPFSIMRNPLYFFTSIAMVGAGLSFDSLTLAALFAVVFFMTHWRTILLEETNLRAIFGTAFDAYQAAVPRFFPNPRLYKPATTITISAPAFMRAMTEAALIPLAFLGGQGVVALHHAGVLPTLIKLY